MTIAIRAQNMFITESLVLDCRTKGVLGTQSQIRGSSLMKWHADGRVSRAACLLFVKGRTIEDGERSWPSAGGMLRLQCTCLLSPRAS